MLLIAASLVAYAGFACFALAMGRQRAVSHRRWLRLCGLSMLIIAYALCISRDGPSFGSVLWTLLISAAAISVALTLAWRRS